MAFQQGLSGLNASSKSIDVISNNIANAGTVGFKGSQAHFSDVYAASLQGSGASTVGIGVNLAAVFQQFTQGNVTATNNPLDISINGNGFFRMSDGGEVTYTRSGQFHLDKSGFIVNDQLKRLTGYPVDASGSVIPSTPIDLQISASQIPPRSTDNILSGDIEAVLNLDSREANPAVAPFDFANPSTYNFSTGLSVYDTLGVSHTLTSYYVRTGPGAWTAHVTMDNATPQVLGNLTFNSSGALTSGPTYAVPTFALATGATTPWSPGTIDFTGTTQYGSESSVDRLVQGGYTSGSLAGLTVGSDGVILGRYTNGQTRDLGQVVLSKFTNPQGLKPIGDNQWVETSDSGAALIGAPDSGGLGVLQASSVEESNVDLTAELVSMITAQRNYQANAQSIKTQDQVLNTLVNLR
jgi:flagellar hook protein FlgE